MQSEDMKSVMKTHQPFEDQMAPGSIGTYYEGVIKFKAKVVSKVVESDWLEVEFERLEHDDDIPFIFKAGRKNGYSGYCGWNFVLDPERN